MGMPHHGAVIIRLHHDVARLELQTGSLDIPLGIIEFGHDYAWALTLVELTTAAGHRPSQQEASTC